MGSSVGELDRSGKASGPKRWGLTIALALGLYLSAEAFQPPSWQPSAFLAVGAIRAYQVTLSPALRGAGAKCRFQPTCSHYGIDAIRKHGTLPGLAMTAWRIAKCGPWGPPPGEDLP